MGLKEQVYSVLIVSASERFNITLSTLLPPSRYQPVCNVANISSAKRAAAEREFDFVIINSPLPDNPGIRFAIDTSNERESVILLLVRAELSEEIYYETAEHGVRPFKTYFKSNDRNCTQLAIQCQRKVAEKQEKRIHFTRKNG